MLPKRSRRNPSDRVIAPIVKFRHAKRRRSTAGRLSVSSRTRRRTRARRRDTTPSARMVGRIETSRDPYRGRAGSAGCQHRSPAKPMPDEIHGNALGLRLAPSQEHLRADRRDDADRHIDVEDPPHAQLSVIHPPKIGPSTGAAIVTISTSARASVLLVVRVVRQQQALRQRDHRTGYDVPESAHRHEHRHIHGEPAQERQR